MDENKEKQRSSEKSSKSVVDRMRDMAKEKNKDLKKFTITNLEYGEEKEETRGFGFTIDTGTENVPAVTDYWVGVGKYRGDGLSAYDHSIGGITRVRNASPDEFNDSFRKWLEKEPSVGAKDVQQELSDLGDLLGE